MRHLLIIIALMAAALPAFADSGFTYEPAHQVGSAGQFGLVSLHGLLTNTGDARDTFFLHKEESLPFDWATSFCVGDECFAPFIHDIEVELNPDESVELFIDFQVNTAVGSGECLVSIVNENVPEVSGEWNFAAIHNNCDVLVVDDSQEGTGLRALFETNLAPRIPGIWPRSLELPTLVDLQGFPKVFWLTGDLAPTLDADDRALLGDFLDAGGALMLSGQDLAQDICDPASPNYSIESKNWFENNLGLAWVGNSTATSVLGEPGDFIGDGLNLALDAGQTDPDILSLMAGPATVSFRYDSPELGIASAVRTDHGRLFYMGFGIEGIVDTRGAVAILLDRICMALFDPTDVESAESFALSLDGNYPNPFNPKTSISFQSTSAGTGELRVLDVRGRQVHSETILVSEGRNQVEFNGESLSSAVYLYQVIMSNESVSGRMVLAK